MARVQKPKAIGEDKVIELPRLNKQFMIITLISDSSLICHNWAKKAVDEILAKQMKKAKLAKEAKDPIQDFRDCLYLLAPDGKSELKLEDGNPREATKGERYGFPTIAFKSAAVDACSSLGGITKVQARQTFHMDGDLVEIHGTPHMCQHPVKIGMGTTDIHHRAEFKEWWTQFPVCYNANVLSPAQVANMFETAGFAVGVGEWRPERNGPHGRFHVATEAEVMQVTKGLNGRAKKGSK